MAGVRQALPEVKGECFEVVTLGYAALLFGSNLRYNECIPSWKD